MTASIRLVWRLTRLAFKRQFTYRAANLAGLATNIFFGFLRASVMVALYRARTSVSGISLQSAITFTGLSQALIAYLSLFGWWEVIYAVRNGEIASDLLKPIDYYGFWLARDIGRAAANFLVRGAPIILVYALFFGIKVPQTLLQWLGFMFSLLFGLVVSFSWRFLVNLTAFWIPDSRGIGRVAFSASYFLSGFLMPLRFFPDWFVRFCEFTPFPSMINTIVEVYLGVVTGPMLLRALSLQLLWIAILVSTCQLVMRAGIRHLVIQGG